MKPDKPAPPKPVATDLAALAEAFAGVSRLGEGPKRTAALPPRAAAAPPPVPAAAARPVPSAAPLPPAPDDAALLREAMRGVRRLDSSPPRPVSARGPEARIVAAAPVAAPPPAAPPAAFRELVDGLTRQLDELRGRCARLEHALEAEQAARAQADAERDRLGAALTRALATAAPAAPAPPVAEAPVTPPGPGLRELAAERGLLGDDELTLALRALFDARRAGPLLDELVARDGDALATLFSERLILVAEGEPVPPGRVPVIVSYERSEVREDSAIRKALSLFSTACLIQGLTRVVFVGGSPAYRRQLNEGLDPRIKLRFVPGGQRRVRPVDGADVVIVWGASELDHAVSAHFPDAIVVQHRGIIRMLEEAARRIAR